MGDGNKGENAMRPGQYLRTVFNIALGAGTVVGGAYLFSRIKEKQESETRLSRLEQIVEQLSKEK
jgi:hypothetical protein